jgi:ribosomal protein L7/L12
MKVVLRTASSTNTASLSCMRPFHTTLFRYKKEEETPDEPFVELPKKGRMPVPKEIKELGDKVLSLNAIENMILSQYLRDKMGFDEGVPNPFSSMLRDAFGDLLLPGVPKYAIPGEALMMQQQQMMAQMMAQGATFAQQASQQAAPAAAAPAAESAKPAAEEKPVDKSHYDIKLEKFDEAQKIKLIKELRAIDPNLTIKAAKEAVEGAPSVIKKEVKKEDAQKIKAQLEALGATISLV